MSPLNSAIPIVRPKGASRVDQALVDRGLHSSREKAQRAVLAGQVTINGQPARKPSDRLRPGDVIAVVAAERYVGRGGLKLEHALKAFSIEVRGARAIDLGASTGGFTDCLLQAGANQVFAVDVGQGQLAWKLRQDPRVVVVEKTNARTLTPKNLGAGFTPVEVIVIDCSFISLRKILPAVSPLLRPGGMTVALIKPQFEAGKKEVDRGAGVITDPGVHARVINELQNFVATTLPELNWTGLCESPLLGPAGNKEFFALLRKSIA